MEGLHQMRSWMKCEDYQQLRFKSLNRAGRLVHRPPYWRLWVICLMQIWHRLRTFCSSVSWTLSQVTMIWRSSLVVSERSRGQSYAFVISVPRGLTNILKQTTQSICTDLLWSCHNLLTEEYHAMTCKSWKSAVFNPTALHFSNLQVPWIKYKCKILAP